MLGIKTDFQAMDEIQNYNFTCGFVWVWNLVSHVKGRT
jgi:hypothetical protein